MSCLRKQQDNPEINLASNNRLPSESPNHYTIVPPFFAVRIRLMRLAVLSEDRIVVALRLDWSGRVIPFFLDKKLNSALSLDLANQCTR